MIHVEKLFKVLYIMHKIHEKRCPAIQKLKLRNDNDVFYITSVFLIGK